jgi:hypothetical protein
VSSKRWFPATSDGRPRCSRLRHWCTTPRRCLTLLLRKEMALWLSPIVRGEEEERASYGADGGNGMIVAEGVTTKVLLSKLCTPMFCNCFSYDKNQSGAT